MPISKQVQGFVRIAFYAIAIFWGTSYLIQHFAYPDTSSSPTANRVQSPIPEDPKFSVPFEAGKKMFKNGEYGDALDAYGKAQAAVSQLNDEEYDSLKQGRLEIAQAYEAAGDTHAASNTYVAITSCAIQEAKKLLQAHQSDEALARSRDAEQFAPHVIDNQSLIVYRAMDLVVMVYRTKRDIPDALREQQKLIDYLEGSGGQGDSLAEAYANLGCIHADAKEWDEAEQSFIHAGEISDLPENRQHSATAEFDRNFEDYELVSLYLHAGKNDIGLTKAEEYYTKYRESPNASYYIYAPPKFAALGLALARQTNNQEAIDIWEKRTHEAF